MQAATVDVMTAAASGKSQIAVNAAGAVSSHHANGVLSSSGNSSAAEGTSAQHNGFVATF